MKFCLISIFAAAAALAATGGPVEPQNWRYAHPDARILAGIDLKRLSETAPGRQLRDQFVRTLGAPLLDQAERLVLSSVIDEAGKRSDILILSGSFELARLRKLAVAEGAKMASFRGLDIAAPAGATAADPHLAWVAGSGGATTVLIGTRPAIHAAAERARTRTEPMADLGRNFSRALELTSRFPVWVVCDTVPAGFGPKALDDLLDDEDGGLSVEGLDLGIQLAETAQLGVWLWTGSEGAAERVLGTLQSNAYAKTGFILAPWLPDLKGTLEDNTLVLNASFAPAQFAERTAPLLAAFALPIDIRKPAAPQAALAQVRAKVDANVPVTGIEKQQAPPPPPRPLFVRIEGLDDGAKEIPYKAPK